MKSSKEALKGYCQFYWTQPSVEVNRRHLEYLKDHRTSLPILINTMVSEMTKYNNGAENRYPPATHPIDMEDATELATILINQFK